PDSPSAPHRRPFRSAPPPPLVVFRQQSWRATDDLPALSYAFRPALRALLSGTRPPPLWRFPRATSRFARAARHRASRFHARRTIRARSQAACHRSQDAPSQPTIRRGPSRLILRLRAPCAGPFCVWKRLLSDLLPNWRFGGFGSAPELTP